MYLNNTNLYELNKFKLTPVNLMMPNSTSSPVCPCCDLVRPAPSVSSYQQNTKEVINLSDF